METSYDEMPFNGLATSSEIIEAQMQRLGIETSDLAEPLATSTTPPGDVSTLATQAPTQTQQPLVYDGPVDSKKTLGQMLQEYGIPTSAADLISSAESAVIDIPKELQEAKEPVWTILSKGDRLQGIGALLIVVAAIMALINLLR